MAARAWVHASRDGIERSVRCSGKPRKPRATAFLESRAVAYRDTRAERARDLDPKVQIAPRLEAGMELEELGDGIDVVSFDSQGLSQALRWRDEYTQRHSENVAALSVEIAQLLGMPPEESYLVVVNGASVPRHDRASRRLSENDSLAILPPLKGG